MYDVLKYRSGDREFPTVRIKRIVLDNFKSVEHGEIEFDCSKHFVEEGTTADILGIYGQNGSGKTSLIEALSITKSLMMGESCNPVYADCIAENAAYATITIEFDLQYPNKDIRTVQYSYSIRRREMSENTSAKIQNLFKSMVSDDNLIPAYKYEVEVFSECIKISEKTSEKTVKLQTVIDTNGKSPFGPVSKRKEFFDGKKETLLKLEINKSRANDNCKSFVFSEDTIKCFFDNGSDSNYYNVLTELVHFANFYLFVVDTKSAGIIQSNAAIPIFLPDGDMLFSTYKPVFVPEGEFDYVEESVAELSEVTSALIPDLKICVKVVSRGIGPEGDAGMWVELLSIRNNCELPIRYESDGVRRIISEIMLIKKVYNQKSTTVAIDEFDAGIFEYLLGEILNLIEESGKGQFIFTSHNLRPLEVIDKRFLCFTTTNPRNRYYRLKSIGNSNNIRKTYYRELIIGEQDEILYNKSKKYRIIAAFKDED